LIWKLWSPLKVNIIVWFSLSNNILTWDNGLKRGWIIPKKCFLCKLDEETFYHLFVTFPFFKDVQKVISSRLFLNITWNNFSLEGCLHEWMRNVPSVELKSLPCHLIYNLWWTHNQAIFHNIIMSVEVVNQLVLKSFMDFKACPEKKRNKSIVNSDFNMSTSWGFFDRSSQGHPVEGGVGFVFYINQIHYFYLKNVVGRGSNNKEEFVSLWDLLSLSNWMGYWRLQVMGDSKLVID